MKSEGVSAHAPKLLGRKPKNPIEPVWLTLLKTGNPRFQMQGLTLKLKLQNERRKPERSEAKSRKEG